MWLVPWVWYPLLPLTVYLFLKGLNSSGLFSTWKNPKGCFLELTPESGRAGCGVHQGVSASLPDLRGLSANMASELLKPEMKCWL